MTRRDEDQSIPSDIFTAAQSEVGGKASGTDYDGRSLRRRVLTGGGFHVYWAAGL